MCCTVLLGANCDLSSSDWSLGPSLVCTAVVGTVASHTVLIFHICS